MRDLKGLSQRSRPAKAAIWLLASTLALAAGSSASAQDVELGFEGPPTLRATDLLPAELQQTPYHSVEGPVTTEDHFYHFDVKSHYGRYKPVSMEMLKIRAHEIRILNRAVELKDQYEFLQSAGSRIEAMGEALVGTVVHPVETVRAVGKGIGKKVVGIGRLFKGRTRSKRRDSFMKELLLAKHKRKVAYELDVDVYSSNPQLQDLMDSIATERAAGQAAVDLGAIFIPGAVGVVVSVGKFEANMKAVLLDKSPGELADLNDEKLEYMAVLPELRKQFINHPEYSPRHQTFLVGALEQMRGVKNRSAFIRVALHAKDEASALYYQKTAELLAYYHLKETKLRQLANVGGLPVAYTEGGLMVVTPPHDYGFWDEMTVKALEALQEMDSDFSQRQRELVTAGRLSQAASQGYKRLGFKTREEYQVSL
jgi:hypothetical protein